MKTKIFAMGLILIAFASCSLTGEKKTATTWAEIVAKNPSTTTNTSSKSLVELLAENKAPDPQLASFNLENEQNNLNSKDFKADSSDESSSNTITLTHDTTNDNEKLWVEEIKGLDTKKTYTPYFKAVENGTTVWFNVQNTNYIADNSNPLFTLDKIAKEEDGKKEVDYSFLPLGFKVDKPIAKMYLLDITNLKKVIKDANEVAIKNGKATIEKIDFTLSLESDTEEISNSISISFNNISSNTTQPVFTNNAFSNAIGESSIITNTYYFITNTEFDKMLTNISKWNGIIDFSYNVSFNLDSKEYKIIKVNEAINCANVVSEMISQCNKIQTPTDIPWQQISGLSINYDNTQDYIKITSANNDIKDRNLYVLARINNTNNIKLERDETEDSKSHWKVPNGTTLPTQINNFTVHVWEISKDNNDVKMLKHTQQTVNVSAKSAYTINKIDNLTDDCNTENSTDNCNVNIDINNNNFYKINTNSLQFKVTGNLVDNNTIRADFYDKDINVGSCEGYIDTDGVPNNFGSDYTETTGTAKITCNNGTSFSDITKEKLITVNFNLKSQNGEYIHIGSTTLVPKNKIDATKKVYLNCTKKEISKGVKYDCIAQREDRGIYAIKTTSIDSLTGVLPPMGKKTYLDNEFKFSFYNSYHQKFPNLNWLLQLENPIELETNDKQSVALIPIKENSNPSSKIYLLSFALSDSSKVNATIPSSIDIISKDGSEDLREKAFSFLKTNGTYDDVAQYEACFNISRAVNPKQYIDINTIKTDADIKKLTFATMDDPDGFEMTFENHSSFCKPLSEAFLANNFLSDMAKNTETVNGKVAFSEINDSYKFSDGSYHFVLQANICEPGNENCIQNINFDLKVGVEEVPGNSDSDEDSGGDSSDDLNTNHGMKFEGVYSCDDNDNNSCKDGYTIDSRIIALYNQSGTNLSLNSEMDLKQTYYINSPTGPINQNAIVKLKFSLPQLERNKINYCRGSEENNTTGFNFDTIGCGFEEIPNNDRSNMWVNLHYLGSASTDYTKNNFNIDFQLESNGNYGVILGRPNK